MPYTSYGGKISFGWEFENKSLDILDWYEPDDDIKPPDWATRNKLQREAHVKTLQANPRWDPDGPVNWSKFHRLGTAPAFLCERLEQEIFRTTWEVAPGPGGVTEDLGALYNQLNQVRTKFPATDDAAGGFQVHIVFEAPNGSDDNRAYWNARIAALYQLLNDYAALKTYARGAKAMTKGQFVGAATPNLDRLVGRLNAASSGGGQEIESKDEGGSWVGKYKYHYVGMRREVYGEDNHRLGLEIRSGWKKDWGRFQALIEKVVAALENLDGTVHLKSHRPDACANFYLEQHLEFKRAQPLLTQALAEQLRKEAQKIVAKEINDTEEGESPKVPYVYKKDDTDNSGSAEGAIVYKRWMLAFVPWEHHASLSWDSAQCDAVQKARKDLVTKVTAYFAHNQTATKKTRKDFKVLHGYFKSFFSTLRLYRYL